MAFKKPVVGLSRMTFTQFALDLLTIPKNEDILSWGLEKSHLSQILLHKLRAHNPDEGSSSVVSHGFRQHSFPCSWRAPQENSPWRVDSNLPVQLVMCERQLHSLFDFLLLNIVASNILQTTFVSIEHTRTISTRIWALVYQDVHSIILHINCPFRKGQVAKIPRQRIFTSCDRRNFRGSFTYLNIFISTYLRFGCASELMQKSQMHGRAASGVNEGQQRKSVSKRGERGLTA